MVKMSVYFDLGFVSVPAYGCMIAAGVVIANIIAMYVLHRTKLDFNDFILLEAYCFLGAFIGAKLLYLIVSYKEIQWDKMLEPAYFNQIMLGGFVFYGGLIGGLLLIAVAGYVHKINASEYIKNFVFLIPFIHAFGRLGCFFAGCCYGIPYDGPFSVIFPKGSYAISGIKLFPVQIVEAVLLFIISGIILYLQLKYKWEYAIETYLVLYAIIRFGLEYLRYDSNRGFWGLLSTSQWISIFMILIAGLMIYCTNQRKRKLNK